MELTMEQAVANAAAYQEAYDRAKEILTTTQLDPSRKRQIIGELNDAKIMLEWYYGYTEKDRHGNERRHNGLIQKLAGEAQRAKESSNLGERFSNRTFGNFEANRDPNAFNLCRDYANNDNLFRMKKSSIILVGGVGSGKTHLAAAIANTLIDRGIPVLFSTFPDHLEHIREEYDHTGKKEYLAKMKTVPMLVLDDLGKERKTEWTQNILFDVINYRYEHLLPVIITTNFSYDDLANYIGDAVFSRLYEMGSAIATRGKDYRRL